MDEPKEVSTDELEARLLANPELLAKLKDAIDHPERSVPRPKRDK